MSTRDERIRAEKGCQVELRKHKIGGAAEFRKWAVRNHPDKGGKLRVFQKVSGCVDLMYKAPENEMPSTSFSQATSQHPPKKTKFRSAKPSPKADYFWSAFDEYEIDDDILFGKTGRSSGGYRKGERGARRSERDGGYEKAYGFRGSSMQDDFMYDDWDHFEDFVREHVRARERETRRGQEKRKEWKRERESGKREREKRPRETDGRETKGGGGRRKGGASPTEWQGPANPYEAPRDSAASPGARARARAEKSTHTLRERARAATQEALERLRRTIESEGRQGGVHWRHRLSRPQIVFMVAQLTCMQSVFLSTAFKRL